MPRRDAGNAQRSIELRILRAWIDASRADTALARVAQFEGEWLKLRAEIASNEHDLGSIADVYLPQGIDPKLRQLFALPSNQAQAELLGERDEGGVYHAGWADLSQSEFDALILWMTPIEERNQRGLIEPRLREPWEIGRDMTPKRARDKFGRRAWVREDTALRYFRGALRKLRLLFGVAKADNPESDPGQTMGSMAAEA